MAENINKWDVKQLATGGGGVVALLFMFQSQGVDMMTKNQQASNSVVIEKTIANQQRINKLEGTVQDLNDKIDRGFDSLRLQLRDETSKISEILRISNGDRWTKTEHSAYDIQLKSRLDKIEGRIEKIQGDK